MTILDFKTQTDLQVVGAGPMLTAPAQIGDWWVMPANSYQGKIPADIQQKLFDFLASGQPVLGFLIAEDMREIEVRREQEQKKKATRERVLKTGLSVIALPFVALGYGLLALITAIMAFDPMLIAVLPDGRWICLGTWYD